MSEKTRGAAEWTSGVTEMLRTMKEKRHEEVQLARANKCKGGESGRNTNERKRKRESGRNSNIDGVQ